MTTMILVLIILNEAGQCWYLVIFNTDSGLLYWTIVVVCRIHYIDERVWVQSVELHVH